MTNGDSDHSKHDARNGDDTQRPSSGDDATTLPTPSDPAVARQIGPYRLLERLGEGGMGEVYLAEQKTPIKRRVALKLIKVGMDTKEVIARFESERQALAMMDHSNVAKIFDAGSTDSGRPYFVMEHVSGVTITEYCDQNKLANRERLDLFTQVCEGVQHAHQKGVIHRDLKPSNVLVTLRDGRPVPKIIDFGVAKATAQKLTDLTVHTHVGALVGTPAYMSPEQARLTGSDIDTRTDVYALGVMLYELLVGALPFDPKELRKVGFEAMVRKICDEEPPKPSTRLSTLGERSTRAADRRRTGLPALRRELSGDLDWITMKALEKDRTRRYSSPSDLAADIDRYRSNQPVLASPPSVAYRARKFMRRHARGMVVAATGLVMLVAFAVTMTVQAGRIAREAKTAEKVSEFLADMLGDVDPQALGLALRNDQRERVAEVRRKRGATEDEIEVVLASLQDAMSGVNATDVALRMLDEQVLSTAAETIEQELAEEPEIAGRLEHTIGTTYEKLGLYEKAQQHTARAVAIRGRELGPDHPGTLDSKHSLALVYQRQGRYEEAEALYREVAQARRRVLGGDDPATLESEQRLATSYAQQGRFDEAERIFLENIDARRSVFGDDHPSTLISLSNLAILYRDQGRYDEAEQLHLETLEVKRRVLGEEHSNTLQTMGSLGAVYQAQARFGEAEAIYLPILEAQRRQLGDEHPSTLRTMNNLANSISAQGRHDEAETLFLEVLEAQTRVVGDNHPDVIHSMTALAVLYKNQGRFDESEPYCLEIIDTSKRVLGEEHPRTLAALNNLATLYIDQLQPARAEPLLREALEIQQRVLGDEHPETAITMINLACVYRDTGSYEKARSFFEAALKIDEKTLGPEHPYVAEDLEHYAILLRMAGEDEEAAALAARAESIREKLAEKEGKE